MRLRMVVVCRLMRRSRSPTTPAGSMHGATGWLRWSVACSGIWRSATHASRASAELADALLASRSAIAGAVNTLESLGLIRRSRAAGERMDRIRIDMSSRQATGSTSPSTRAGRTGAGGTSRAAGRPANDRRSCWSGLRSPIFWWSGFPPGAGVGGTAHGATGRRRAPRADGAQREGRTMSARPTPGIVARDVCKSFGSHLVLDKVNLTATKARFSLCWVRTGRARRRSSASSPH